MAEESIDWSAVSRRGALALAMGGLVASTARAAAQSPDRSDWSSLDALGQRAVADRVTPGMQVSVMKRGELVYSKGFGHANLETATPVTPSSIFRIGSITKQFTAAAILRLAETERLSLDDKLERYFPGFPRGGEVGLRQLLTHTSGLPDNPQFTAPQMTRLDWDLATYLERVRAVQPLFAFDPGTGFLYSNVGYHLLGRIVETASRQTYANALRALLLDPAGLGRTSVDDSDSIVVGRASGYRSPGGPGNGFFNARFLSMTLPGGAGAMLSTTDDLCRWHAALLGGRLLRPASLEAMTTPGRLANGALPTRPSGPQAGAPPQTVEYGFGIRVGTENGRRIAVHTGGINGFQSELKSHPAERVSVACMINVGGGLLGPDGPEGQAMRAMIAEGARIALG